MIVYYAPGGGRGHLTRARRVLEALSIDGARIVASVSDGDDVLLLPQELEGNVEQHARWVQSLAPSHLIVDTFPAGIQGELSAIEAERIDYVARLLRWDEYRRVVSLPAPRFESTWVVEPLTEEHMRFVRANSATVADLALRCTNQVSRSDSGAYWLIVHSGPASEVEELIAYTSELRELSGSDLEVRVATPCEVSMPEHFRRVDAFPATELYAGAERIITAAGFNVMLETEEHRDRHEILPFPRRFDDQFLRAARRRAK
jgi:UDP:flavonoid glycosyltransferase YjiC (YdhE family)